MKRFFTIMLTLVAALAAEAQPAFVADHPQQQMGELAFQNPKTVTFTYRNAGTEPLVLKEVRPSCGCVSVSFSNQPLMPGQQASLTAVYDCAVMGTFHRELAVYTNAQDEPFYLSFDGKVVLTPAVFTSDLPVDLGDVKLSSNVIEFDDVNKGDRPVVELEVANVSHTPYTPQLMHLPPYLTAEYIPTIVQPGHVGKIRVTLESHKLVLNGLNQSSVYLARYMGDRVSEENEIEVSAVLLPAFHNLTAKKLERAPRLVMMDGSELLEGELVFDMQPKKKLTDKVKGVFHKGKLSRTLQVTNVGEEPLTVSAVQVWNRALGVSLSDRVIQPHATAKLKITLDPELLAKAKAKPRVLLICNDPRRPKIVLDIVLKGGS